MTIKETMRILEQTAKRKDWLKYNTDIDNAIYEGVSTNKQYIVILMPKFKYYGSVNPITGVMCKGDVMANYLMEAIEYEIPKLNGDFIIRFYDKKIIGIQEEWKVIRDVNCNNLIHLPPDL